ncbi:phage holin family protein [Sphingomonas sp.]|uniref:phage holin family protein n=1 Tax=Sphingomonas sp. TaxID=28214 RepID=UPI0035BBE803
MAELKVEHRGDADVEPGIATLATQLIDDTREVVSAEIAVHKARIGERIAAYKGAAVFFAIAGVLALAALIALLVGLILTLATLIGPGLATLAVVVGTLVIAGVLAMIGKGRLAAPAIPERRA